MECDVWSPIILELRSSEWSWLWQILGGVSTVLHHSIVLILVLPFVPSGEV